MRARSILIALTAAPILALPTAAVAGGSPLATDLVGAEEAPGPGDANATGQAALTLNQGEGTVCFDLSWADIDGTVSAAHIHVGDAGDPGPIVVGLFGGAFDGTDSASGCIEDVNRMLVKAIRKDPASYYVNVHSSTFPAGAIRGQLG